MPFQKIVCNRREYSFSSSTRVGLAQLAVGVGGCPPIISASMAEVMPTGALSPPSSPGGSAPAPAEASPVSRPKARRPRSGRAFAKMMEHSDTRSPEERRQADADRAREMVISLLGRTLTPEFEAIKEECQRIELEAMKAIESAMHARQESSQVKDVLEKARAEQAVADAKARDKTLVFEKAEARLTSSNKIAEEAKANVTKTKETERQAVLNAENAVSQQEEMKKNVENAQEEVFKAVEAGDKALAVLKEAEDEAKAAKKQAERTLVNIDQTKKEQSQAAAAIAKAEANKAHRDEKVRARHGPRAESCGTGIQEKGGAPECSCVLLCAPE
jgi:hypothetical protein